MCGFELATQDALSGSDQISVYTFGSPRTGNAKFARICDGLVQSQWRCVVAGDSTVATPSYPGYQHVGNMAMFTRNGQLTLEKMVCLKWWQSETSSHPMYKLTSYFCALAAWSQSHSGQDARSIGLWKWPLDKATSALFSSQTPAVIGATDVENPPITPVTTRDVAVAVAAESLEDVVAFSK